MTDKIYCYRCDEEVAALMKADPDFTSWTCPACGTLLDQNFTDDEIEWEGDEEEEEVQDASD
jgi:hypothetical protein